MCIFSSRILQEREIAAHYHIVINASDDLCCCAEGVKGESTGDKITMKVQRVNCCWAVQHQRFNKLHYTDVIYDHRFIIYSTFYKHTLMK